VFNDEQLVAEIDVNYGITETGKELKLDIYAVKREFATNPLPVIIFLHGGGWETGDKRSRLGKGSSIFFAKNGFFCVSINYRLSGEAIFPAQIHDAKAAVRWIKANSKKYNLEPEKIGVWGHSAGGHLSALLGTSSDHPEIEGSCGSNEYSSRVQAVATSAAPVDLLQMGGWHNRPESPESRLVGGPLLQRETIAKQANPIMYINGSVSTPFLIIHGTHDEIVPYSQAELLFNAIDDATLIRIKGGDHDYTGGNIFWGEIYQILLAFFNKHLMQEPESYDVIEERKKYMAEQVKNFSRN
jgi:acetyl esterase/lipase